jgi:hypothetical protein
MDQLNRLAQDFSIAIAMHADIEGVGVDGLTSAGLNFYTEPLMMAWKRPNVEPIHWTINAS